MRDFDFGNKIYQARKKAGFSQKKLASVLGISDKAVSKWENGESKPSITQLAKLSEVLNFSIDDLVKESKSKQKKIYKIVLTGGPCSGKTTALSWLQNEFTKKGYKVLFINETATQLILSGLKEASKTPSFSFEKHVIEMQLATEKIYEAAARDLFENDKVLIVCDRGCMDCKSYISKNDFKKILTDLNTSEVKLRDSYDAVFHLVSVAKDKKELYSLENNKARGESVEEAALMDDRTLWAWTGHPHLRVIDNSTDFKNKMLRLVSEISSFLGEPEPFEIERKFLIKLPNMKFLNELPNCKKVEIIQAYLVNQNGQDVRIRQRGENGDYIYTQTTKRAIDAVKRYETERRITKEEFLDLLMNADPTKKIIRKTRYCLTENNQYFEIDIFPFWKDKALLEIELRNENDEIKIPKFIKVIKEVTDDKNYFNSNLAKN